MVKSKKKKTKSKGKQKRDTKVIKIRERNAKYRNKSSLYTKFKPL